MRIACLACLAVLVTGGCAGRHSSARPAAPSESAAEAAVERFAVQEHAQRVVGVSCDAPLPDGSRPCAVTLSRTCDTYAVRLDRAHRVRVTHKSGTCYWLDLDGTAAVTLGE
jgi:hypothetical protein